MTMASAPEEKQETELVNIYLVFEVQRERVESPVDLPVQQTSDVQALG